MQISGSSPGVLNQKLGECCPASCVCGRPPGDSDEHGKSANHSFKVERAPIHKLIYPLREDGDSNFSKIPKSHNAGFQALRISQIQILPGPPVVSYFSMLVTAGVRLL